tara:strand:+ start:452 stop:721 length:270 start_codon:yes stop_codon:yes gene_type:complete
MKNKRQYRDSAMFTMIGYIGIILVVLSVLVGVGDHTGFNQKVQEGIKNDPRPKSNLMNYTHPNLLEVDTLTYQDEDVMWIGGDGDTIWE